MRRRARVGVFHCRRVVLRAIDFAVCVGGAIEGASNHGLALTDEMTALLQQLRMPETLKYITAVRDKACERLKQRRIDEGRLSGRELCEGGLVETGGKEDAGAMEYIKRDTSADDAAEARAKEEAERNLARMRAMFSAAGGVEGRDRKSVV